MKVNLHLHSRYSDGTLWPEQVVARAKENGLEQVSLTDHDCLEGTEIFLKSASETGIHAIGGVEIDCEAGEIGYNSEVLGYFPGGNWSHTRSFCLERMEYREKRINKLISLAAEFFKTELSFEELKMHKMKNLPPGLPEPRVTFSKPDLFEYLKFKEIILSNTEYTIFKKMDFLKREKDPKPDISEVIAIIISDNGIPVLPHPGLIFRRDPERMKKEGPAVFKWFSDAGILALECNHYAEKKQDHTAEINRLTRQFALELNLRVTWGSDCHGPGHHNDTMEKFWGTESFPFDHPKS